MCKGRLVWLVLMIMFMSELCWGTEMSAASDGQPFPQDEIERFVAKEKNKSEIPGMYVVIVKGNQIIYDKGWGYADKEQNVEISKNTLFELGSNSKAFTGLAILHLEQEGVIRLDDPVNQYLPWFKMKYKGEPVQLTLRHFLNHTSGVPYHTIGGIPETDAQNSLLQTVQHLTKTSMERLPGESFNYASINYDVLGLVIEQVSGESYEDYIKQHILRPLSLNDTYVGLEEAGDHDRMATGYKMKMFKPSPYISPTFRGNTPAGYIVSSPADMARWLMIQLGTIDIPEGWGKLIDLSHVPDRSVAPSIDTSSYGAGWQVFQSGGGEWSHGGTNPTFSSFITLRPQEQWGVAVLSNMNSDYTKEIGQGISRILLNKDPKLIRSDTYQKVDTISSLLLIVSIALSLLFILDIVRTMMNYARQKHLRKPASLTWYGGVKIVALFGTFIASLFYFPTVLFNNLPWSFIKVWGPATFLYAVEALVGVGSVYMICQFVKKLWSTSESYPYFSMFLMSLISGFGNAFIIFIINMTFSREGNITNGLLACFILGLILYIYSQRYIRVKLITISNNILYDKRREITGYILASPYQKFENSDKGDIYATLNNDTETISRSINMAVNGVTSFFTLCFCFLYLGSINSSGLLMSIVVIIAAAGIHFVNGRRVSILWEQTRDIQNTFYHFIGALMEGFKELKLNKDKREDFQGAMGRVFAEFRLKRIDGESKFANTTIIGELLFTMVIGVVAFFFPLFFTGIDKGTVQTFVFVFLYMTGPVNALLNSLPQFIQINISWKRIKSLIERFSDEKSESVQVSDRLPGKLELRMQGVTYHYAGNDGREFSVGPIDCVFRSGEVVFITGGNGSGKSTLAKLICGLYTPDQGEITMNGVSVSDDDLNQYFTAIFSDFYLFDRLYGMDTDNRTSEINHLLMKLELQDKVQIIDGQFKASELSTGQKKRLALLIGYLEDRPVCLFDEWAADQDPVFRNLFYNELLPEMKKKGKCVIAITHDDMYFHLSDKVMKLDVGQLVSEAC